MSRQGAEKMLTHAAKDQVRAEVGHLRVDDIRFVLVIGLGQRATRSARCYDIPSADRRRPRSTEVAVGQAGRL